MPATSPEREFLFHSWIALAPSRREPRSVPAFPKARNYLDASHLWRIQLHRLQLVIAAHPAAIPAELRNSGLASAWRRCAATPAPPGISPPRIRDPLHSSSREGTAFP